MDRFIKIKVTGKLFVLFTAVLIALQIQAQEQVNITKNVQKKQQNEKHVVTPYNKNIDNLKLRQNKFNSEIKKLKDLANKPVPKGLTKKEQKEWKKQTEWINSVVERYSLQYSRNKYLIEKSGKSAKQDVITEIQNQNVQFLALQQSLQNEARVFQTISNVMKTRHDAAMASIRNMK